MTILGAPKAEHQYTTAETACSGQMSAFAKHSCIVSLIMPQHQNIFELFGPGPISMQSICKRQLGFVPWTCGLGGRGSFSPPVFGTQWMQEEMKALAFIDNVDQT